MRKDAFLRQLAHAFHQRLAERGNRGAGNTPAEHGGILGVKPGLGGPRAQLLHRDARVLRQLRVQRVQRAATRGSLVHTLTLRPARSARFAPPKRRFYVFVRYIQLILR